jgi:bacillithiol biosynthesis cysteine-adding enzyme BshC
MQILDIEVDSINQFSKRDKDYYTDPKKFADFLAYPFEYSAFEKIIHNRSVIDTDRNTLHDVLKAQYASVQSCDRTLHNIEAIKDKNCFTVITAHQPSLLTGPLYYILKILSAVKLANKLNKDFPENKIIPVFVIGGEDHDFEEMNHLNLFGNKISWSSDANGAVGRFPLHGLKEILDQVNDILGPQSKASDLMTKFYQALESSKNYGEFSFKITHALFDHMGLVILRMDEARLKNIFKEIIKEEIFKNPSEKLIEATQAQLEKIGYKNQAFAREINLFYHCDAGRKRIEKNGNLFHIVDTDISFSAEEITNEIDKNPQNFSPNVALRPLYQEMILPNLAYIGGGGELAYWMERKTQFQHFGIPFPMLIRRCSALIISDKTLVQIETLGFTIQEFFDDELKLIQAYVKASDHPDAGLKSYHQQLEETFSNVENLAKKIDPTLTKTVQSELVKAKKSLDYLESKLTKSIKQKEEVQINRIKKLKSKLFPAGLQERHDNILEFISSEGHELLDALLDHCDPFDKNFKVFITQRK